MATLLLSNTLSRLITTGIAAALFLATSFSSVGQELRTKKPDGMQQLVSEGSFKTARLATSRPLTSTVYYRNGLNWALDYNGRYTYDAQGNQTSFTRLPLTPQSQIEKDSQQYDLQGNQIFNASYTFHQPTNAWVMNWGERTLYTYNTAGRPTEEIYENWNAGVWEKNDKIVTVYNGAGFPTEQVTYDWDNNSWVPEDKVIFTFSAPATIPSGFVVQSHNNGSWADEFRAQNVVWRNIHAFEMTAFEAQVWTGGLWLNMMKSNTVYDPLGGSVTLVQNWNGLTWVNSEKETVTFDAKMNLIGRKWEVWVNNAWVVDNEHNEQLTYNAADQITERILIAWDPSSNTLKPYQKEVYNTFLVMGRPKNLPLAEVKVYPNPTADFITLQLSTQETPQAMLTDLTGREVLSQRLTASETRLDLSGLPKGTYLLRLQTPKGSSMQKIIKQ